MTYKEAKEKIVRKYRRNEGYFGDTVEVGLAFDEENERAVEVTPHGFYRGNFRKFASEEEMLYYFEKHRKAVFPQVIRMV